MPAIIGMYLIEALGGGRDADGSHRTQGERLAAGLEVARNILASDQAMRQANAMTLDEARAALCQLLTEHGFGVDGPQAAEPLEESGRLPATDGEA